MLRMPQLCPLQHRVGGARCGLFIYIYMLYIYIYMYVYIYTRAVSVDRLHASTLPATASRGAR